MTNLVDNAEQYAGGVTRLAVEPGAGRRRALRGGRPRARAWRPASATGSSSASTGARPPASGASTDGTGLGLSLVAEHVRLHGGRVWVESGADGENRFVVELPDR